MATGHGVDPHGGRSAGRVDGQETRRPRLEARLSSKLDGPGAWTSTGEGLACKDLGGKEDRRPRVR